MNTGILRGEKEEMESIRKSHLWSSRVNCLNAGGKEPVKREGKMGITAEKINVSKVGQVRAKGCLPWIGGGTLLALGQKGKKQRRDDSRNTGE